MGWEELTPLEIDQVTSQDKAVNLPEPLDGVEGSLLEVSKPDVLLETWKQAEDGKGTILRFLAMGETGGAVKVSTPLLNVESAWLCTAFEDNQQPLAVSGPHAFTFDIKPHEIITVRLQGSAVPFR
jgi:alpha-mannosidase